MILPRRILNKQIDYAVHEKYRYEYGADVADIGGPDGYERGLRGGGIVRGELFGGVGGFPDVAYVYAGKYADEREQEGVGEGVEDREKIDFSYETALRERNQNSDQRSRAYRRLIFC